MFVIGMTHSWKRKIISDMRLMLLVLGGAVYK